MGRLILILLAIGAAVAFYASHSSVARSAGQHSQEASVPKTAKTISFVLLMVLMLGVVTGGFAGL